MKRIKILSVIILIGVAQLSYSQVIPKFGIKAGLNSSDIQGFSEYEPTTDFHAGLFTTMHLIAFGVQGEVLYSRQGAESSGKKLVNEYLLIPVLGKLYIIPGILNLQGGLQYGVLLTSEFMENDVKTAFENGDWGLPVGVGIELSKFQITGRYIFGFSDINSGSGTSSLPSPADVELNNRVFQLSLGYRFGGK